MKLYIDPSNMEYNKRVLSNLEKAAFIAESGFIPMYIYVITGKYTDGYNVIDIQLHDNFYMELKLYSHNKFTTVHTVETNNWVTKSSMAETIIKLRDMYKEALKELNSDDNYLKSFKYTGNMLVLRRNDDKMFSVNTGSLLRAGTSSVRMKFKYPSYIKRNFLLIKTSPERVKITEVSPNGTVVCGDSVIVTMLQLDELLDVIR